MGEPGSNIGHAHGSPGVPPGDASRHLAPGTVLAGNYEIIAPIGEGGMAVVYRARQRSLNRDVALKALHSHFAQDEDFVRRFDREAGALAGLNQGNIVSIIDRGVHEGIYFFVMEYVAGETLDRRIIDNRLSIKEWRDVVMACRDALEYVHKRNIIHLDIKPSNILIDAEGRVKLSDFGIAKILEGGPGEHVTPNASGSGHGERAFGTSYYMAPEQAQPGCTIDARADIYALGATFYKMMTRQMPDPATVIPPSEANNDVPVAVDAVILRAMAPDREDRYQTVREFCDDLLKAMKDQSVSITSILDFRNSVSGGSSALYTGADFRSSDTTPKPASRQSSPALKKVGGNTPLPVKMPSRGADAVPQNPTGSFVTPTPPSVRGKALAAPTAPKPEGGYAPAPAPDRRLRMVTVLLAVVGVLCLGLIAIIIVILRKQS
jgi:serine/threonine protein kinase